MRPRLVQVLFFTIALSLAAGPAMAQQPPAKGDGAMPLSEYDNVPPGLMMMKVKKKDTKEKVVANDNGMDQVMGMADIKSAYANGDYAIAASHLKAIAGSSYPEAEELLGIMYHNGQGVKKDPKQAMKWLLRAADVGRGLAAHYLAIIYYSGDGVKQDSGEAVKWLYITINDYKNNEPDRARAQADLNNILPQLGRRNREAAYDSAHSWLQQHNMVTTVTPP